MDTLLKKIALGKFDPKIDSSSKIPDEQGNYIVCLKKGSRLPESNIKPIFTTHEGLDVIYVGKSGVNLRKRDYTQHFNKNAGSSTLRKSLGVLFGYRQIPRDKDPNTGKTKFSESDELELSNWMNKNLLMFTYPTGDYESTEQQLIMHFNPPLNLKGSTNHVNSGFRQLLSRLRAEKG